MTDGTVTFTDAQNTEWQLPLALVEVQREFFRLDAECSRLAAQGDDGAYQAAKSARLDAVLAKDRDPWLRGYRGAGRGHQADAALRACAKAIAFA